MHRRILLFLLVGLAVAPAIAQQNLRSNARTANAISVSTSSTGKIYYANRNEPPRALEFKERTVATSAFLTNINQYFNIPVDFTFVEAESNNDRIGMRHHLMQQYYKSIEVEGMCYRVHEKDGFVRSANGKAIKEINLYTRVSISEQQAFQLAVRYLNTKDTVFRHGKKLIVSKNFTFAPESFSIAYQFDIDVSLVERWRISIDAQNGQLINKVSLVNNCFKEKRQPQPLPYGIAVAPTRYYGNQTIKVETFDNGSSQLAGQTQSGGSITTYDAENVATRFLMIVLAFGGHFPIVSSQDNTYNGDYYKSATSVQWATEQAYEYYYKKHNRNSFDNHNGAINSFVHVDQKLDNAFWTGSALAFGDGSNNNPLVELDVVSHELTHGVTQYEAQLQYYNEPGALNESFSDILGKAVEFYTFGDTATWQMAKHYQDGGLRDFSNPNLKNQPDTYLGQMWSTDPYDYGGVHYNSGVQNFWFYLLCEGGNGINDHQMSYSVNAIGMDTAVNITYRNLTEYLSSTSDFLDSRIGSLLATADLYGENSVAYQEVGKAWDAVGMIEEPIITSTTLYDITATTVKVKGEIVPQGNNVTYHFEYGTTPALGMSSPTYSYAGKVEGILSGLQSQTKYYFRLVATNEHGSSFYNTDFTTLSLSPLVKIKQTVDVTESSATMYGAVNPNSLTTSFYFEYGTTAALGSVTPTYSLIDTTEFLNVSVTVAGLLPRQTYYYRLVATNNFGSSYTGAVNFFTAVKPMIFSYTPATGSPGTEVIITGKNFNPAPEKNIISFGATRTTALSSTGTEIKVMVPTGASVSAISVLDTESALTAKSTNEFIPTYNEPFAKSDLQPRAIFSASNVIYQTLVEDMDGDNKPDIVALTYKGFAIFQNVNDGGDLTKESFVAASYPLNIWPNKIYVADMDGNGLKDVVIAHSQGFKIYPNFSVAGYIFFGVPVDVSSAAYSFDIAVDDFDADGHIDIAEITDLPGDSTLLTVFRNQNPKDFLLAANFEPHYTTILPYYSYGLYSGDLNNDGNSDLIVGTSDHHVIPVAKNNSVSGHFNFEEVVISDSTSAWLLYFLQDLNQDDKKDIIAFSGNMSILENNSSSSDIVIGEPFSPGDYYTFDIAPGDIDGDGKVDLVVGDVGKFDLLKNMTNPGDHLSNSSLAMTEHYNGITNESIYDIDTNDLNGDGRPDVVAVNRSIEIWQNSANTGCNLDPTLVKIIVSQGKATISLPSNTTLDQYDMQYEYAGTNIWNPVSSTELSLSSGYSYQLRVRTKCYLGFSDYYYINFATDCVDLNSFKIISVDASNVYLSASSDISSFEVQYSLAGKDQWQTMPWYWGYISGLLPGTIYDLRFRSRCILGEFRYEQFTTLCPELSALYITNIAYNTAVVNWTTSYGGNPVIEFSDDNVTWHLIDETRTILPLIPGKKYFVRGKLACTDVNANFIYASFVTPCPKASSLLVDDITPFGAKINWADEASTGSYTLSYVSPGAQTVTIYTPYTSVDLDDLNPGTQYTVSIAPQCIGTENITSVNFVTVCYAPFNLSASNITYTTARLSWSENFSGSPYFIDYSIANSNAWRTIETISTNIELEDLIPGIEYEARVHINCTSETPPYASVYFTTDVYAETAFAPNPANDKLTIYPSKNLIGNHFSINDSAGQIIFSGELLDYTIDLSGFSAGVYVLRIDGEKPVKIFKQ